MSTPSRPGSRLASALTAAGPMSLDAVVVQAQQAAPKTWTMQSSWPASSSVSEKLNQFVYWVDRTDSSGQQLMDEWFETIIKRDVISLPILSFTPQMFGWFKQPFKGWDDLKGRKMRAVGMNAQILNMAGASVVSMPGGEIVPAAQRGVVDAAEWCCPAEDVKLGFHNVWKYYYMPSMHEMTEVGDLIISKASWKALSPDLQEIVKMAATETYLRWWLTYSRDNAKALAEMRTKHGVNVRRTPTDVLIKQLQTWDTLRDKFAKEDAFFAKVVESQRQYAANVVPGRMAMYPAYSFAADYYWKPKPGAKPNGK